MSSSATAINRNNPPMHNDYLFQNNPEAVQVHLFSHHHHPLLTQLISSLRQKSIATMIHSNNQDLEQVIAYNDKLNTKRVCLIDIDQKQKNNHNLLLTLFEKKSQFSKRNDAFFIQYFSLNKTTQSRDCLKSIKEIVDYCDKCLKKQQLRRIKLTSVRSLKRSRQKSSQLSKQKPLKKVPESEIVIYQELYYYLNSSFESTGNGFNYSLLIASIDQQEGVFCYHKYSQLILRGINQQKKCLIITPINQQFQEMLTQMRKPAASCVDILVLGDIKPSNIFFDKNIVLATNDPNLALQFLKVHGFDIPAFQTQDKKLSQRYSISSSDFKTKMNKIMREDSQYSSSNNIFTTALKAENALEGKQVHHWMVDKDINQNNTFVTYEIIDSKVNVAETSNKKKIKKLKSQSKLPSTQPKNEKQKQIQHNYKQITSINVISGESDQNKRNFDKSSLSNVKIESTETSPRPSPPPSIQRVYDYPPRAKQYPTYVIQEVSEEYRGSNKSSMMNIDPDVGSLSKNYQIYNNHLTERIKNSAQKIDEYSNRRYTNTPKYTNDQLSPSPRSLSHQNSSSHIDNSLAFNISSPNKIHVINPSEHHYYEHSATISQYHPQKYNPPAPKPPIVVKRAIISSPEEIKTMKHIQSNNTIRYINNTPIKPQAKQIEKQDSIIQKAQIASKQIYFPKNSIQQKNLIERNSVHNNNNALQRNVHSSPIDQLRILRGQNQHNNARINIANRTPYQKSPGPMSPTIHSPNKYFQGFQKVEKDGIVIYRRKTTDNQAEHYGGIHNYLQKRQNTVKQQKSQHANKDYHHYGPPAQRIYSNNYPKVPQVQDNEKTITKNQSHYQQLHPTINYHSNGQTNLSNTPMYKTRINQIILESPKSRIQQNRQNFMQQGPLVNVQIKPQYKLNIPQARSSANLNESMFSRMSELHTDGSILRRNNVRFGVKLPQKEQKYRQASMLFQESKLKSGIYKANDTGKKNLLNRVISGQEFLQLQKKKLLHVITKFSNFHYIIHDDLIYLNTMIGNFLAEPNDKIQNFSSIEQLFQCIRPDKIEDQYDIGFIFALKKDLKLINTKIFPEEYYIVIIEREHEDTLQINEDAKKITLDQIKNLPIAQKIILDSQLYQYVAYRNNKRQIELLADKFLNSQFILQKIQKQFTCEIIDFYYCELPRLTRLYLLCDETQLPQLLRLMNIYQGFNPNFNPESCKLICTITSILNNDQLIMKHPTVTFINNPQDIKNYRDILKYAHHFEEENRKTVTLDHFFYHTRLNNFEQKLQNVYPGRFLSISYPRLADVYQKIQKINKLNAKYATKQKNYLILPQTITEKLILEPFTKIYMLGKGKSIHPSIIRVLNIEELLQLLRF